jgi:hypothetical protein
MNTKMDIKSMIKIHKSDGWTGYAALICASVLTLVPLAIDFRRQDVAGLVFAICFGIFGLYFALRGLFLGSLPNRICAGVALVYFACIGCKLFL